MGAIDLASFEVEFMERTQQILKHYGEEYEFTLLMNCLLALILLTCEKLKDYPFPDFLILIDAVPELNSVRSRTGFVFNPVTSAGNPQPTNLENYLKRMRNSIAHATVFAENEELAPGKEKEWVAVTFVADNFYCPGSPTELKARFEYAELRDFAIGVSTLYQKAFLGL